MSDPAIFGVGVTRSRDNPAEPAFLVLVDMGRTPRSTPSIIGGLRVVYMHHALEVDDRPACISVRGAGE